MAKSPVSRKAPPARSEPDTVRVAGLPAVKSLFEHDPGRAERLFYDERMTPLVGVFCKLMAAQHKPYRMVSTDELTKITGSQLHGGVVVVARPKPVLPFNPAEARDWARAGLPLVILDGVGNPHNLGAIARTMAFFGLEHLVVSDHPGQATPSEAAVRVSEGGLEWVAVHRASRFAQTLKRLKESYRVVGTALGAGLPLEQVLNAAGKPVAIVLGNEEAGLPPLTLAACDEVATIPGSGRIQSLNVAATAAILIHELAKERR